jgi:uncharacterized protein (TIGR00661 family)
MRILFAVQGTGNGHISRAREVAPLLKRYGELDMLVSGTQADVMPGEPLAFNLHGFSFIFGKKGGVDHWRTYRNMNLPRLIRDIRSLPLEKYDLIINDFEPVTAWACRLRGIPLVALSHQAAFLSRKTPRPAGRLHWAECLFTHYAPVRNKIGFHFERYDDFIHTPVIRSEIRNLEPRDNGHITVYLPAYDDKILIQQLSAIPEVRWEVFSKHSRKSYSTGPITIRPVNNHDFNLSVASSHGLFTGGGFESPAEALFLGKKVLSMPMKNQYEQLCNAEALRRIGVPVIHGFNGSFAATVRKWLSDPHQVRVDYRDETAGIVDQLVKAYT